jgi:hypothetical protein
MNTNPLRTRMFVLIGGFLVVACGPTPGVAHTGIEVANVNETHQVETTPIPQVKVFDQCDANSTLRTQVQFGENIDRTLAQEVTVKGGVSADAGIKVEAEIAAKFADAIRRAISNLQTVSIEVPAHTKQKYTIMWKDIRQIVVVSYNENGVGKTAEGNYRFGLELISVTGTDIPCSSTTLTPTFTPSPTPTATPTPTSIPAPDPIVVRYSKGAEQILVLDGAETAVMLWIENGQPFPPFICPSGNCTYLLRLSDQKWRMFDKENDVVGWRCPPTVPDVPEGAYRPHGDMEIVWCMLEGWNDLGWGMPDIRQVSWKYKLFPDRLVFLDETTGNSYVLNQDKTWERENVK